MPSTSSPRIVFLDIDGTYAFHGEVPQAHADAVRQARANGHVVLLCTGRARCAVSPRLMAAGFDGVVGSAGAYVEIRGEVLRDEVFPADLARRSIDALAAHGAVTMLESAPAMYALPEAREVMDQRSARSDTPGTQAALWEDLRAALREVDDLRGLDFAKAVTLSANADLSVIAADIGPEVAAIETSIKDLGRGAGELYLAHVTKAVGIDLVISHLGMDRTDVIAMGDGPNDLEMLDFAHVAVGIAGGHPGVIARADLIADGPEHGGLAKVFVELELI